MKYYIGKVDKSVLEVGSDFVDAVAGEYKSCGTVEIGENDYTWRSTFSCTVAETCLRAAARKEGARFGSFSSVNTYPHRIFNR